MCEIHQAAYAVIRCFEQGGKLLLCGNGGSAADCGHIAGELCKGFLKRRPLTDDQKALIGEDFAAQLQQGLPAIDLTAQTPVMTAIINDLCGDNVFAQQVMAFGRPGDVLLGISTSGNAENVRRALITAKSQGMTVIGLSGGTGGKMQALCDLLLLSPEKETYKVQEDHIKMYHQLCILIEEHFFKA
ncbi:MAG: SIS domain-containing protein [Clostridiales bacterium]|nr:SIS domain-containing protein [Clostridiales bacterium]